MRAGIGNDRYIRGACGATRWEGESHERCGMSTFGNRMRCVRSGVVERVKRNTLKWFSHVERMGSEEFVEAYESESEGPNRRGRLLGRWKDRMEEYLRER